MKIKVGDIIEMKHYEPPHLVVAVNVKTQRGNNGIRVKAVDAIHNDECLTVEPNWIRRIIKQKKTVTPSKEYFSVHCTTYFLKNDASICEVIKSNNRRTLLKKMKELKNVCSEYGDRVIGINFEPIRHVVETSDLKGKFVSFNSSFKKPKNYVAL